MQLHIPPAQVRLAYYQQQYKAATISDDVAHRCREILIEMQKNQDLYTKVAAPFAIMWQIVGALHNIESDLNVRKHLANGDPLEADTVHVPKGIMHKYFPDRTSPFDFVDAGIAALMDYKDGWNGLSIPDVPAALMFFDQWNGLGEWEITDKPGLPYLFSGTSAYVKGKFTSDGHWDPEAVSKQIGVAAIMKTLGIR